MITGSEVAVDNEMRRAEKQNEPPVNRLLQSAESTAEAISLVTGSVAMGGIAKVFGIAKRFTSGLGVATLKENLEHLGDATEAALSRVEKNLGAQGVRIDEIERRLESDQLLEGIKAATLQAQRTADKKRLERMALILANGVAENDLEPESLDDMMRAAAELTVHDVEILRVVYDSQVEILFLKPDRDAYSKVHKLWDQLYRSTILGDADAPCALARLQAHGLIYYSYQSRTVSESFLTYGGAYFLSKDGKRFYERLQQIASFK